MPALEVMDLKQRAVVWLFANDGTPDDFDEHGERKVRSPIEIPVRWNYGRTEAVDPNGETIALDALVVVNRDVPIGSIMWEGKHTDLPESPNLYEVAGQRITKDLKGRVTRRTLELREYSSELPTVKS